MWALPLLPIKDHGKCASFNLYPAHITHREHSPRHVCIQGADIVFMPYNYIIDEGTRQSLSIQW